VAGQRGEAEVEVADRLARKLATAQVLPRRFAERVFEKAVLVLAQRPAHDGQQSRALVVLGRAGRVDLDSGAGAEYRPSLGEADLLHVLDEREGVAVAPAGPALVSLAAGVDVERWPRVVVERTEGLVARAGGLDGEIRADHSDDVAGGLDLFGQLHRVGRH